MSRQYFNIIQAMNIICVTFVVLCCLFGLSVHSKADSGALTIVQQEDDSDVTLENENSDNDIVSDKYEPFHPTSEWQTVQEGQAIPAGLHVRMNFESGHKEAKLMDDEAEYKYWRDGDRQGMMNMERKQHSMNELKKALKDFKTTQLDETDLEREAEVKKRFRSYKELKDDFASMNMDIKTDFEIIEELLTKMKHEDIPRDDLLTVLKDLEYYLHQIDNGVLFKDLGGIPHILNIMNKSTDDVLRMEAALVLGAATSSNPKVQIGALEAGALQLLLRLISVNSSLNLKRKLVFCIATLCRHFPYAQKRFLKLGGLVALRNVFEEPGFEKVKVKIVSFLNDLLIEKTLAVENTNLYKTSDSEKLNQYKQVYLLEAMIEQGWCERFTTLLQLSDHESREHVLNTMYTLAQSCKTSFTKSLDDLKVLKSEYSELAKDEESGDDYFTSILSVIDSLLQNIGIKDEL